MKIAIIGTGISGLTCAHYLYSDHQITLFEANDYIGGHTATIDVSTPSGDHAIDTGFIVFNDRTYSNFQALMTQIGVQSQATQMSFSVRNEQSDLEYNGHSISSLFAQKRNLINPSFYQFIFEILRFNKEAQQIAKNEDLVFQTLGDFLTERKFSGYFCQNYILPMGAAIWSSTLADMRGFPLKFFIQFFLNHGLLEISNRPQWYVIKGGSREYVKKLIQPFASAIRLNSPVSAVTRDSNGVILTSNGKNEIFDEVIFACHSDQALDILTKPTSHEISILSNIQYQKNQVILHTDTSLLPQRKKAWASWNYHLGNENNAESHPTTLTYNMNILQGLKTPETFCVTLNQSDRIDPSKILREFQYSHPVFTMLSTKAQKQRELISGINHTWFCGAYWYNGFHEDGVRSALDVVTKIQKQKMKANTSEVLQGV